jgi:hypothetical protein
MNILMLYHFSPPTTANYLARAFKAEGHDVRTAGTMASLQGFREPYRLWGPHTYPLGESEMLEAYDWRHGWTAKKRLGDWMPDLMLWVESGNGYASAMMGEWSEGIPSAAYFIDSHNPQKLEWHKRMAGAFHYRFCAMRPWCDELGAHWLPLACDPEIHTPRAYSEEYDLAWVGGPWGASPLYRKRFETMERLQQRYRCNFKSGVYFEDMADVYGSAKIGWHMSVTGGDLDMRVFEVMCSGRPLVTDSETDGDLNRLFSCDGLDAYDIGVGDAPCAVPCWSYDNDDEMWDELEYLLTAGPELRAAIGADARAAVLAHHTYRHRVREILRECGL